MKTSFEFVMNNYLSLDRTVDSKTSTYANLCRAIPFELRSLLDDSNKYLVKGSMGQGNRTDYPWVSVLDRNITTSTQKGLYVVYLFKKDMSGFYLTLAQGITNFGDLFGREKYSKALKVAKYFKDQIENTTFSKEPISIGGEYGDLGYGYECTTILQKYYPKGEYDEEILKEDFKEAMKIYGYVASHFATQSYNDVIKSVLADEEDGAVDADTAVNLIKEAIDEDDSMPYGFNRRLKETIPHQDRTGRFSRVTSPKFDKIDYLKKAKRDAKIGLLGEELVIKYEQDKLIELGLEEYVDRIKWVSKESDAEGYDILSYDRNERGEVIELNIEVKSTISKVDTEFFVSRNELNRSKELKNRYCVYRLYDVYAEQPKFYKAYGEIDKNFILDPYTYMARYKYSN